MKKIIIILLNIIIIGIILFLYIDNYNMHINYYSRDGLTGTFEYHYVNGIPYETFFAKENDVKELVNNN